jgi:hypothetical protein
MLYNENGYLFRLFYGIHLSCPHIVGLPNCVCPYLIPPADASTFQMSCLDHVTCLIC